MYMGEEEEVRVWVVEEDVEGLMDFCEGDGLGGRGEYIRLK